VSKTESQENSQILFCKIFEKQIVPSESTAEAELHLSSHTTGFLFMDSKGKLNEKFPLLTLGVKGLKWLHAGAKVVIVCLFVCFYVRLLMVS